MRIEEKGGFCEVCTEMIYDFSEFYGEDFVNTFDTNKDVCGKFREDQVGKDLSFSLKSEK